MTTDALIETALDEAEAIVRAEWIRLQHDDALLEHAWCPVGSEMPAARPRPFGIGTLTAMHNLNGTTPPRRLGASMPRCGPRRIWPTQRSPPQPAGTCGVSIEQWRWCPE
jgi:hypothetical protein